MTQDLQQGLRAPRPQGPRRHCAVTGVTARLDAEAREPVHRECNRPPAVGHRQPSQPPGVHLPCSVTVGIVAQIHSPAQFCGRAPSGAAVDGGAFGRPAQLCPGILCPLCRVQHRPGYLRIRDNRHNRWRCAGPPRKGAHLCSDRGLLFLWRPARSGGLVAPWFRQIGARGINEFGLLLSRLSRWVHVALGRRDLAGGARRHVLLQLHAPSHDHRADLDARQLFHHLDELTLRVGAGEMGPRALPRGCRGLDRMGAGSARWLCA